MLTEEVLVWAGAVEETTTLDEAASDEVMTDAAVGA